MPRPENMVYKSAWWCVDLPPNWSGHAAENCSEFEADSPLGVLQVSAARKDDAPITDADLREFALDRQVPGMRLEEVKWGQVSGFTTKYRKKGFSWQEWWLRLGPLMLYATYNVIEGQEAAEQEAIAKILASMRMIPPEY